MEYYIDNIPKPLTTFIRNYSNNLTNRIFDYLFTIKYFDERSFAQLQDLRYEQLGVILNNNKYIPAIIKPEPINKLLIIMTEKEIRNIPYENFTDNLIKNIRTEDFIDKI